METGRQMLNRVDLEILDAINREWQAERLHTVQQERLLREGTDESRWPRAIRMLLIAAGVAVVGLLLIGLAVAAASGSTPGDLVALLV